MEKFNVTTNSLVQIFMITILFSNTYENDKSTYIFYILCVQRDIKDKKTQETWNY